MTLVHLRDAATRFNLLQHSFYTRWTAGELSLDELRDYAAEYRHVVAAMPRWLAAMAVQDPGHADTLRGHAREEAAHVPMWDDFAEALGCDRASLASAAPNAATGSLLAAGDELVAAGRGAEVLWALESQAPAVSEAKLTGLREHYAIDGGRAARYFEVHTTMDIRHTRELESLLEARPGSAAPGAAAEMVLERLFGLLSSVERQGVAA